MLPRAILVISELNLVCTVKDEVVAVARTRVGVQADAGGRCVLWAPAIDLDLRGDDEVAGEGLVGDHRLVEIGVGEV